MRRLSAAEAASRVYANSLNALAHPAEGLDAAVGAVGRRAAFELTPGPVSATCRLIRSTVDALNLS